MLNIKFTLSLILFANIIIFPHNEFYQLSSGSVIPIVYDGNNGNLVLYWQNEKQIPIYLGLLTQQNIPDGMDLATVLSEFTAAQNKWVSQSSGCIGFTTVTNSFGGIDIYFSSNTETFNGQYVEAVTPLAVSNINNKNYLDADPTDPQGQWPATQIILNATNYNTGERDFLWTTQFALPNPTHYVNFQNVVLHELGHLMGFSHCSIYGAIMYDPPFTVGTIYELDISGWDIESINNICLIIQQNPFTALILFHFKNRQHYFYDYDPVVFLSAIGAYRQEKSKDIDSGEDSSENKCGCSKEQLFTKPDNYKKGGLKK